MLDDLWYKREIKDGVFIYQLDESGQGMDWKLGPFLIVNQPDKAEMLWLMLNAQNVINRGRQEAEAKVVTLEAEVERLKALLP